jgi:hypothetical protein
MQQSFLTAEKTLAQEGQPELLQVLMGFAWEGRGKRLPGIHGGFNGCCSTVIAEPDGHLVYARDVEERAPDVVGHQVSKIDRAPARR